ncbi:unnamed protein product [Adineta steineri]|uniref:Uncharacterized protein n=1 Tax=Adineta steineri TaxID=433720 RepID=A0A814MSS3_9BILA|nr:unnamed protein product [Adineta steineri]CAF1043772.1 unnamed protein product [Adineta steineri]CAF1082656.1 unnamed protein product [Adineta steineri]CAF3481366.1 unnamed protein product [Adineta steineri]CAF3745974.1 unnamed protein product [Adineta steineri]
MICNIVRLLIFTLLVNIIFGFSTTSNDNRRLYQLLKQRSAENDNEYVWFTRDIHQRINDEEMKANENDLFHPKIFNNIKHQKYPNVKNSIYE